MIRRHFLQVALVAAAAQTACNRSGESGGGRKRIGVVPKATAHVFWQSVHAGAVAAGREADIDIDWKGPAAETDFSRQIEIVDSMINARVDGIVLAPTEATSLASVVDRAAREGVPLTIFDSGVKSENYVSYVSTNNYDAGALAAKAMGDLLGGSGEIIIVKMVPGSSSTMEREQGFEETLAKDFPRIKKVAEQYCMSDRAKALAVTENMLTAQPAVKGLFASAEPATVGAAQALKSRGMSGKVKMVGFDSSDSIEQDLRGGVIDALVVQDPFNIGYEAVKTVIAAMNGQTPPKRIDSPATVVTRDNIDSPEIDKLLHPDLSAYLG